MKSLFDEFIEAVQEIFPNTIIQFEDFSTNNAFKLVRKIQEKMPVFLTMIFKGPPVSPSQDCSLLYGLPIKKLEDQRILFLGAGEAGVGIADMISLAMLNAGLTEQQARRNNWFVDSTGLVCASRTNLAQHKLRYAHQT